MNIDDTTKTSCAFVPVYCYYDRHHGGEVKTPILFMEDETLLLKAILLEIDPNTLRNDELKDEFIHAYNMLSLDDEENTHTLDPYDIYPYLISILHTDNEDIYIYVCELYEHNEPYFKKTTRSNIAKIISYKENIDKLIQGQWLDPQTEKILVALSEENYLTSSGDHDASSVKLF